MKNEKTNLIIWAVVALVIGVIIGTFLIAPTTTGNANAAINDSIFMEPQEGVLLGSHGSGNQQNAPSNDACKKYCGGQKRCKNLAPSSMCYGWCNCPWK